MTSHLETLIQEECFYIYNTSQEMTDYIKKWEKDAEKKLHIIEEIG